MIIRLVFLAWILVFFALAFATLADTIFGARPLEQRLSDIFPRVVISAIWPLAMCTPRGRYLLWRRWRDQL